MESSNSKRNVMPCAACKLLRRRCTEECIFLPYFPPWETEKFVAVHRVYGASNISKMLQEIPINDRRDAVTSLVYEATVRLKEPVYGCVALISSLQKQVLQLQSELDEVCAEILTLRTQLSTALSPIVSSQPNTSQLSYSAMQNSNDHDYYQYGDFSAASDVMVPYPNQMLDSFIELADMYN